MSRESGNGSNHPALSRTETVQTLPGRPLPLSLLVKKGTGFTVLLLRRRNVDETERLRQPANVEKTFGLLRHIRLLQMVDQLRRLLAFRFPNRFEDAGFCNAAEIVVDGWSPPCLDHVEPDGSRQNIGLVKPGTNAVGGDTALIVAVSRLVKSVHRK